MASTVKINGDEKGVVKAFDNVADAVKKVDEEYKKLAKESRELDQIATRAMKSIQTETDKYRTELGNLKRALDAGKLSQDDYNKAVAVTEEKFRHLKPPNAILTIGQSAISSLAQYAAGFVSIGAAVGTVGGLLRSAREEITRLSDQLDQAKGSAGELLQVATDQKDLQQLFERGRDIFRAAGAPSLEEANRQVFDIRSANLDNKFDKLLQIADVGLFSNVGQLATTVKGIETAGGKGTFEEITSELLKAAEISKQDADAVGVSLGRTLATTLGAGFNQQETSAAISRFGNIFGNVEVGSDRLRAFADQVEKQGLFNTDLVTTVQSIQRRIDSGEKVRDVLGDREQAITAFRQLGQILPQLSQDIVDIRAARTGGAFLEQKLQAGRENLELRTVREAAQAKAIEQLGPLDAALQERRIEEFQSLEFELRRQRGQGGVSRATGRFLQDTAQFFGLLTATPEGIANVERDIARTRDPEQLALLRRMLDTLRDQLAEQKRLTTKTPAVPTPERN